MSAKSAMTARVIIWTGTDRSPTSCCFLSDICFCMAILRKAHDRETLKGYFHFCCQILRNSTHVCYVFPFTQHANFFYISYLLDVSQDKVSWLTICLFFWTMLGWPYIIQCSYSISFRFTLNYVVQGPA